MLNIIAVKFGVRYFITNDTVKGYNRYINLNDYIINGNVPKKSFHTSWNEVSNSVRLVQRKALPKQINHRIELIDPIMKTKVGLLQSVPREDAMYYDEDSGWLWQDNYKMYSSMYKQEYDMSEGILEEVKFKFEVIMEVDDMIIPTDFSFSIQKTQWAREGLREVNPNDITHQLLDRMIFPEILLPTRPCSLSLKETYEIVRQYVKQHINYDVASITSDYDFCFTVKKKIPLSEDEKYTVNVNMFTKKKEKLVVKYRSFRDVVCYEATPSGYTHYPMIEEFKGDNQEDLKNKINAYCEALVDHINEPVTDCPECKGRGVIVKELVYKEDK